MVSLAAAVDRGVPAELPAAVGLGVARREPLAVVHAADEVGVALGVVQGAVALGRAAGAGVGLAGAAGGGGLGKN